MRSNEESVVFPDVGPSAKVIVLSMFFLSAMVIFFAIIVIYQVFLGIPARKAEIAELTSQVNVWQARAKELDGYIQLRDEYIQDQEDKFKVATKFENLFMCIADPKQIMAFEELEEYIANKKEFFELRR